MKAILKRIASAAVSLVLVSCVFTVSADTLLGGDINGDGRVNNKDLTRFFQYLSDWDVTVNAGVLDVNNDGSVNNKDLTRLFQYLSGWEVDVFPITVCNHRSTRWVVNKEATADVDGLKTLVCDYCGKAVETEVIPAFAASGKLRDLENGMLALINEARAEAGVSPLTFDYERQPCTDKRVQEITESFSHTRPDGTIYYTVLEELGYDMPGFCGENIASFGKYTAESDTEYGYSTLHEALIKSQAHKTNILGEDFKSVALSFTIKNNYLYVVQMFFS